ncbi:MAG: hypothetical protein WBP10_00885 [Thermoanaerobaculia bacterium]
MKTPLDCHPVVAPSDVSVDETAQQVLAGRRPYEKPRVIDHGRLADIALGGSPGRGDSGATFIQQPP